MTQDEVKGEEVILGGVAAAAYSPNTDDKRMINLGKPNHNTVHEAEMVGVGLALDLIKSHPPYQQYFRPSNARPITNTNRSNEVEGENSDTDTAKKIFIFLDSQSATQHLSAHPSRSSGQNIAIDVIKKANQVIKKLPTNSKITLCWIPGHSEIYGNEAVDEIANEHSHILEESPPFPRSLSSTKTETKATLRDPKPNNDASQPNVSVLQGADPALTFEALSRLPRAQCSALVQLRSGHSCLKEYLHRFKIVDSPLCDYCEEGPETAEHFLLNCIHWSYHRRFIRKKCIKLKANLSKQNLLGNPDFFDTTAEYITLTGRFVRRSKTTEQRSVSVEGEQRGNEAWGPLIRNDDEEPEDRMEVGGVDPLLQGDEAREELE